MLLLLCCMCAVMRKASLPQAPYVRGTPRKEASHEHTDVRDSAAADCRPAGSFMFSTAADVQCLGAPVPSSLGHFGSSSPLQLPGGVRGCIDAVHSRRVHSVGQLRLVYRVPVPHMRKH